MSLPTEAIPGQDSGHGTEEQSKQKHPGEILKRRGITLESATRLGRKAAEAESVLGIHGVSMTAGESDDQVSQANCGGMERFFPVHDTPTRKDPLHRTVELPK